ncbi:unnamed protein product [Parascedosporium putredinis]|uniref:Cytochrome b-c1 complex subunit 2, mitochondrial n=1 Tax=Parascedosporium putredinis TaxID=1442378 RepID=A0A9P1M5Z4_9PEZI|nr:unnamed protein product [Parascedosporium putredinis]CAI7988707.1 unnamed protein product [Parascedosporium putredinis]
MISRSSVARLALGATRSARPFQARGFAAAASGSSSFETYDAAGIKVASRDAHGQLAKLAVVIKAGTRYQSVPGLTAGLEGFAFKNTTKRSALRITRESELLGGQLNAYHTREALVLETAFLREDLPYFAELLAEVLTQTRYTTHEFHEEVGLAIHLKQLKIASNPAAISLDAAHAVYAKPNIALAADGASQGAVAQWASKFFNEVPSSSQSPKANATTYYGGEQRIDSKVGNAITIAFPASGPEASVLASLLGGQSSIKWSPGFSLLSKISASTGATASSQSFAYSDAGLLTISLSGSTASVAQAAQEAVKALQSVAAGSVGKDEITKAIANARFDALEKTQSSKESIISVGSALVHGTQAVQAADLVKSYSSVTPAKLQQVAKTLLEGKASVATVGDLHALPYAQDLGLKV